jgi:hypothetical protein
MEYRSTNGAGKYVHFGGSVVAGADQGSGIELVATSSGTAPVIQPVGDETDKSIQIKGKGTGGVQIGASTSSFSLAQASLIQFTVPALSSAGVATATAESTLTLSGATTNSIFVVQQRVAYNSTITEGVYVTARCSTADELRLTFWNHGASSISGSTSSAYLLQFKF